MQRKHLVTAALILALLIPLLPAFEDRAAPMDEGALLVYPELILKGQLPYRDFETFYGPANPFLLSGVYAIAGPNIFVERAVGLIYRLGILAALFVLLRRWGTAIAGGCLLVTSFLLMPIKLPAYAWLGGIMAILWSLCCIAEANSGRRCFWGGMLAGAGLLFRVDLAPAVLVSALPQFFAMTRTNRWKYIVGVAIGLLPLVWLTAAAGPSQVWNNLFLFPVVLSGPARRLPLNSIPTCAIFLLAAHLIAVLVNVTAGILAFRADRRSVAARLLLGLALLGLGLSHQAIQRSDLVHVAFAAFVSLGILPLSLLTIGSRYLQECPTYRDALLATAGVLVLLLAILPEFTMYFRQVALSGMTSPPEQAVFLRQHERAFPLPTMAVAVRAGRMLTRLDEEACPGQRLFVGPADLRRTNYTDTWIYHMLPKLRPATYFLEMNPLSANRPNSRLANDVSSADWLVLNREWDSWDEKNKSQSFGSSAPGRIVDEQFEFCGHYEPYDLYRHRRQLSSMRRRVFRRRTLFEASDAKGVPVVSELF
jgi:hypothetical protein